MASKARTQGMAALPVKQPLMEVNAAKKKKKKGKKTLKSTNARALLEEFGLCPISMEPMRRPVLPSSGQAFDEINIVRYCRAGNKRCPVSGGPLKFSKGKVSHTIDFALRSLIRQQAIQAKVVLPSIDKDALLRELRTSFRPETAKAVVDDCYLGYLKFDELREIIDEFSAGRDESGNEELVTAAFKSLLAECLACRNAEIVALAVEYMEVYDSAWNDRRVLYEAMAVGQDPDCRGQVLVVLEEKVKCKEYGASHIKALLSFETESVPVQQFQARVAEMVIQHGGKGLLSAEADFEPILNLALRVREDLDGCIEGFASIYDVWYMALAALKGLPGIIDDACLERLFWRENRMVLQHLSSAHEELLTWHLGQHKQALSLCVAALGGHGCGSGMDMHDDMYTSEEDYLSEDEEGYEAQPPVEPLSPATFMQSMERARADGTRAFPSLSEYFATTTPNRRGPRV